MDRLSGLPDDLVLLIVSFVSAKEAAFLKVLSKRFQNLPIQIIPEVSFFNSDREEYTGISFEEFVNGVLSIPDSTTRIRRFSIISPTGFHPVLVTSCLREALKRGVLDVELNFDGGNGYTLPMEIFSSCSVVKLKIGTGFVIDSLPRDAFLPALEKLDVDTVKFYSLSSDCVFEALLLACPVLKELIVNGMYWDQWKWSGNISSKSLERLHIGREFPEGFDGNEYKCITFNTPSLVYLHIADFVPDAYRIVNLDSLVEAILDLVVVVNRRFDAFQFARDNDPISSNPTEFIRALRNVEILTLQSPIMFDTLYFFREAIPVFVKLHHLTITHDDTGFCWRCLPFLLNKAPKLKTLDIKGGLHYDDDEPESVCECLSGYSFLLSCPVKVLKINLTEDGTVGELEQVKHFLGKLSCLETLEVRCHLISNQEKLRIATDLLKLPRASSQCKIKI